MDLSSAAILPDDPAEACLLGRVWLPEAEGPAVVTVRGNEVVDITERAAPTVRDVCEADEPAALVRGVEGRGLGSLDAILANSDPARRDPDRPWFLAPVDLQAVKAAGVTFVRSMLERVIEEQARGSRERAEAIRAEIGDALGRDLRGIRPGSPEAARVKDILVAKGAWSQYLEVGIGPDAEVFTKAQPLSPVGIGAGVGVHPVSRWNNPEPEVVLAVSSAGRVVGAMLGNDVNLRDVEGRSALLLGKAKDNNASCALGPFLRLFDEDFGLDDVRHAEVTLEVAGDDGFRMGGRSNMVEISRDPADIVAQTIGANHQYPDGFVLFLGTMFAPVEDRGAPGMGFTHRPGDEVRIHAARLGTLVNRVDRTDRCPPWTFGVSHLMRNLAARGLL